MASPPRFKLDVAPDIVAMMRKEIAAGEWECRRGLRLRFVYRRRGPSLLVADRVRINRRGQAVASR